MTWSCSVPESQATYRPEIHPQIVWAKFESLAEGACRATARLWG